MHVIQQKPPVCAPVQLDWVAYCGKMRWDFAMRYLQAIVIDDAGSWLVDDVRAVF